MSRDPAGGHRQHRFAAPPGSTEILLVRHGESAPFDPERPFPCVGRHGDPPLAPVGHRQAAAVAERLAGEDIHAVYATSLTRTQETAAPLAARLGLEVRIEPDLREVYLGDWEGGRFRVEAKAETPLYRRLREEGEWAVIPGAESVAELAARCVPAIARIHAAHPDERVAVVVHGGVIGVLCAHATGGRAIAFIDADNCSLHHLVVDGPRWTLRCFNDTAHLGRFTPGAESLI